MLYEGWKRFNIRNPAVTIPFPLLLVQPWWPHRWRLPTAVTYSWLWDLGTTRIVIPAGYECDGASIPFRFYDVVDPIAALIGAFLHDLLYETQAGARPFGTGADRNWLRDDLTGEAILWLDEPRERSDALLRAFWICTKMPEAMAQLGYEGVRLGGQRPWADEEPAPSMMPLMAVLQNAGRVQG